MADEKKRGGRRENAGRPKRDTTQKTLRMDNATWNLLKMNAKRAGLSLGDYVAGLVLADSTPGGADI